MGRFYRVVAALAALFAAPLSAQVIGPGGNGNASVGVFGSGAGNAPTFGQTVLSPGNNLTQVTFRIAGGGGTGDVRFGVAQVTSPTTLGPALYTSGDLALVNGLNTYSGFTVPTIAGQNYAIYLTTYQVNNSVDSATIRAYNNDPYTDGQVFFSTDNASPDMSALTFISGRDIAFTASFTAGAPEPAAWMLMILGFGAVGGTLRRRRALTNARSLA